MGDGLGTIHKGRPHGRGGREVPEKQKNADMGEGGCLAKWDVLFKIPDLSCWGDPGYKVMYEIT